MKSTNLMVVASALVACLMMHSCCARGPHAAGMPAVDFPADRLNEQISLSAPAGLNTYRINSGIGLLVEVTGTETITFPPDFGIRAFLYEDDEWVELDQVPTAYAHGDVVLPPSNGDPLLTAIAHTFPILPDRETPALLRIFIFGRIYRDGAATDEEVGAYVDVVLEP